MAKVEGIKIEIGMILGFKSDIEQSGEVVNIKGNMITVKSLSDRGFNGEYIKGDMFYTADAEDFWI